MCKGKLKKKREDRKKLNEEIKLLELKELVNSSTAFTLGCRPIGNYSWHFNSIRFDSPKDVLKLKKVILDILSESKVIEEGGE